MSAVYFCDRFYVSPGIYFSGRCCRTICDPCRSPSVRRIAPVSFLFPVLILIVGIVILFDPFSSAESVFILFGITAVFYGVTDLLNQYSIRKMRKASEEKEKIVKMGGDSDIEDAEFEEVEEGK